MIHEWLELLVSAAVPAIELMALAIILAGTVEAFLRGFAVMCARPEEPAEIRAVWLR